MSRHDAQILDVSDWSDSGLLANLAVHVSNRLGREISEEEVFDAVAQRLVYDAHHSSSNVHILDQFEARLSEDRRIDPDRPLEWLLKVDADKPPLWWYCLGFDLAATLCGTPPEHGGRGGE